MTLGVSSDPSMAPCICPSDSLCVDCVPCPSHPSPAHCPPAAPSSTCQALTDFPAFALAVPPTQDGLQFIHVHCSDLCSNTTSSLKQLLIFLVPAKVPPAPICLGSGFFFVQSCVLVEIFQGLRVAKRRNNHKKQWPYQAFMGPLICSEGPLLPFISFRPHLLT